MCGGGGGGVRVKLVQMKSHNTISWNCMTLVSALSF